MTVTSVTAVAVALRLQTSNTPHTATVNSPVMPAHSPIDSVEISQQAVAEARALTPTSRAAVLLNKLDTDGDGVVSKTEFTDGALSLLKPASVQFLHVRKGERASRDERHTNETEAITAASAIREYTNAGK